MAWVCNHKACNNRQFKNKKLRDSHVNNMHRPKQFECNEVNKFGKPCTSAYSHEYKLVTHKLHVHSNVPREHKCTEEGCQKAFHRKSGLTNHLKQHGQSQERKQKKKAKNDLVGLKIDPLARPSAEISRLRKREMIRVDEALQDTSTGDIEYKFDPSMKIAIRSFNEAMTGKQKTTIQLFNLYRTLGLILS